MTLGRKPKCNATRRFPFSDERMQALLKSDHTICSTTLSTSSTTDPLAFACYLLRWRAKQHKGSRLQQFVGMLSSGSKQRPMVITPN